MKIAIGTRNPLKTAATQQAFEQWFTGEIVECVGVSVPSGVAEQPMTAEESIQGASNRAQASLQEVLDAEYGVGLEAGLEQVNGQWFVSGWVAITSRSGATYVASSGRAPVLPEVMERVLEKGYELGAADDEIFQLANSKQVNGYIGILTKNIITRTDGFRDAIITALGRHTLVVGN
jgi:inosine/xanthosine triphosphatase